MAEQPIVHYVEADAVVKEITKRVANTLLEVEKTHKAIARQRAIQGFVVGAVVVAAGQIWMEKRKDVSAYNPNKT